MRSVPPLLLLFAIIANSSWAIVVRHDIDAIADPAQAMRFAAVGKVNPDGECVLIAPSWVLTAAHVATDPRAKNMTFVFAGLEYSVAEVFAHPNAAAGRDDLALVRLTRPVRGVTPLALGLDQALELGDTILMAGRGDFGDGERAIVGNDGKLRIAENAITRTDAKRLHVRLDRPENGALPAEGISGPGDSGTPALIDVDGKLLVVGIGSAGSSPKGAPYGSYDSVDVFIPLAPHRTWLEQTMSGEWSNPKTQK